ncbi:hypothetical protein QQG74_00600 [Micromonospora sp. FIMYZ51]|uniref:LppU/SCO3897 family protein n=1 Tax=Micromonospora sp. FIMYZ51 TaxID=3051832 RepID=UPI00311D9401
MTSEGPHRPGQEPDEVPPGGGGPAPYGDRPAQQDSGYGAPTAPDLGWAPAPPAQSDGVAASGWAGQQGAQWGGAQATRQAESPAPGTWEPAGGNQPSWAPQGEQAGPGWPPATPSASDQPAWASAGQGSPTHTEPGTPDPAQPAEWTPNQAGAGWAGSQSPSGQATPAWASDQSSSGQSGPGWAGDPRPEWSAQPHAEHQTPGWANGTSTAEPAKPDWAQTDQPAKPDWASADPPAPVRAEPSARATAQVPQPNATRQAPDEPARSGGWQAEQPEQPAWATGQQADSAAGRWGGDQPSAEGWQTGGDRPAQPDWARPQPTESAGWAGAGTGTDGGSQWSGGSTGTDGGPQWSPPPQNPPAAAWTPAEPATGSARPGDAGPPPSWSPSQEPLPSRTAAERPSLDVEPWAPGEAWGSSGSADPATARPGAQPESARPENGPLYQPAPAPGISPANMVPLPPQEQRVPGASLAATPPADYVPPAPYGGDQAGQGPQPGTEQRDSGMGWGQPESRHDEPQAPAIPAPRTSPESTGRATPSAPAGGVSASASVPQTSRVTPPADHSALPASTTPPQPRVYGRPAQPEQPAESAQDRHEQPSRFDQGSEPRFGDHGSEPRFGDHGSEPRFGDHGSEPRFGDRGPDAFANAPAAPATPQSFPPGLPTFADAPPSNRPVNGTKPHAEPERPADPFGPPPGDRFGGPGGDRFGGGDPFGGQNGGSFGAPAGDPYGGPGGDRFGGQGGDPYGGQGGDPFGGPGGGSFGGPTERPGGGHSPTDHTSAFAPQQSGQPWRPESSAPESDQGRFDAFKPVAEPAPDTPAPKVRNGRVLAAVLVAAVLILAIPLGLLLLLGKIGGSDEADAFNPAVGSCVKRSGDSAVVAECGEPEAFTVVSKVESKDKCPDPSLPVVELRGKVAEPVLCLKDAAG